MISNLFSIFLIYMMNTKQQLKLPEDGIGCPIFFIPMVSTFLLLMQNIFPKDGNKYLKIVFSDAAVHAIQYYPVIRKFFDSKLRKKNKIVAKTIVAKEIARIVYHTLKNKTDFNNRFKGTELQHEKSLQWPRVTSPDV